MKKNLTIIVFLIIALIAVSFIFSNSKSKESSIIPGGLEIPTEDIIVPGSFVTKVLNPTSDYVTFDVKYPSFVKADDNFNSTIEALVKTSIDDHIKVSQEYWQARLDTQTEGENIPKIPTKDDKLSFFSDFTVVQSNSTYISFVLKYGGFSGGAHGYENNVSFNYDVYKNENIKLSNLFPDDPQYLTTISNISREYLKKQFATVSEEDKENSSPEALKEYVDNIISMIEIGTEPKEENFSVFTFTSDKIKIYFADYQVGPHSIGMPEIEIDRK